VVGCTNFVPKQLFNRKHRAVYQNRSVQPLSICPWLGAGYFLGWLIEQLQAADLTTGKMIDLIINRNLFS